MKLTDVEFCRALAFVEGLRIIEEKANDRGVTLESIPTEGIEQLQNFVVDKATDYAELNFPNLSFPDETERETPESLEAWNAKPESRQGLPERFNEGESFIWRGRGGSYEQTEHGIIRIAGRI